MATADTGIVYSLQLKMQSALRDLRRLGAEARSAHERLTELGADTRRTDHSTDEMAESLRRASRDIQDAARAARELAAAQRDAAEAAKRQGRETGEAGDKARGAGLSFRSLGASVLGLAAGILTIEGLRRAVGELTQGLADARNLLQDSATRTGLSPETMKALKVATEGAGDSLEKVLPSLRQFPKRLADARKGTGDLVKVFKALGVELDTFPDADTALRTLLASLERVPDPAQRSALAVAAFGEAGGDLLVAVGDSSKFAAFVELTRRFGTRTGPDAAKAAGDWQVAMAGLTVALEETREQLAAAFGLGDGAGAEMVAAFGGTLIQLSVVVGAVIGQIGNRISDLLDGFRAVASGASGIANIARGITARALIGGKEGFEEQQRLFAQARDDFQRSFEQGGNFLLRNNPLGGAYSFGEAVVAIREANERGKEMGTAFVEGLTRAVKGTGGGGAGAGGGGVINIDDIFNTDEADAKKAAAELAAAAAAARQAWKLSLTATMRDAAALQAELTAWGADLRAWSAQTSAELDQLIAQLQQARAAAGAALASFTTGDLGGGISALLDLSRNTDAIDVFQSRIRGLGQDLLEAGAKFSEGLGLSGLSGRLSGLAGKINLGGGAGGFLSSAAGQAALGGVGAVLGVASQVGQAGQQLTGRRAGLREQLQRAQQAGDTATAEAIRQELGKLDRQIEKYGSASAAAIALQLKAQFDTLIEGVKALPSVLAGVVPDLVAAAPLLFAELLIALVRLPFTLGKALFTTLPRALAQSFYDAWTRIKDAIVNALNPFSSSKGGSSGNTAGYGVSQEEFAQLVNEARQSGSLNPTQDALQAAQTQRSAPASRTAAAATRSSARRRALQRLLPRRAAAPLSEAGLNQAAGGGPRRVLQRRGEGSGPGQTVVVQQQVNTVVAGSDALYRLQRLNERTARRFRAQQGGGS